MTARALITADELMHVYIPDEKVELVKGVLIVRELPGYRHGRVVEVLSPGDRPGEVLTKVADWLSAGTRLVWVIDPARGLARVYRDDGTEQILTADQSLDGEGVVPGFVCSLAEILGP